MHPRRRLTALAAVALVGTSVPLVAATAASAQEDCPGLQFAYVVNSGDGTVSVIDASVDSPPAECVETIDLETSGADGALDGEKLTVDGAGEAVHPEEVTVSEVPFGVVANPARKEVYVTHGAGGRVSVIDTRTHTVKTAVAVGDPNRPVVLTGAAVSPDGARLYVVATADAAGAGSGRLYRIEIAKIGVKGQNPVHGSVGVGRSPFGVAVSSRPQERVYVTNTADGTVSVLDASLNPVAGSPVKVGDAPTGVAASTTRDHVYVVNSGGSKSNTVASGTGAAHAMSSVSVVNTATNAPVGTWVPPLGADLNVPFGATFTHVAVGRKPGTDPESPGEYVYATAVENPRGRPATLTDSNRTAGLVFRIDPTPGPPQAWTSTSNPRAGDAPSGVAVSPDGSWVYVPASYDDPQVNPMGGTVTVFRSTPSGLEGEPPPTVPVGTAPGGVAIPAAGLLPPTITTHPASHAVTESRQATFTVGVSGTPRFTYQWYRNGQRIEPESSEVCLPAESAAPGCFIGDTDPRLWSYTTAGTRLEDDPTTEEVEESDDGAVFHVEVTGTGPGETRVTVTSKPAVLTVVALPEVVKVGEFEPAPPDPDPDAPGFHRIGTMGYWQRHRYFSSPRPLYVDPVNGVGLIEGSKPTKQLSDTPEDVQKWHDAFGVPRSDFCDLYGDAVYMYDLEARRATGAACDFNTKLLGSAVQPLRGGGGGRVVTATEPESLIPVDGCTPSADLGPSFRSMRGYAYEVEGDGAGRSLSVKRSKGELDPLFLRPCPRVGGAPASYTAKAFSVYSAPSGDDELVTLEMNSADARARDEGPAPANAFVLIFAGMSGRGHENVLLRSFGIPDEDLTRIGVDESGNPTEYPNEVEVKARWEVDLRPYCPSWLGSWVARTDDAVLTYCWDERPPGSFLEPPGLSTSAPQGFLVRIPLDADGYPIPRPGTGNALIYEPGSGEPAVHNAPGSGSEDDRGEPTVDSGDVRVLNATIRKIPTLSGDVSPIADPKSGRVFLLTDDDVNGVAVWVMDPIEERFIGVATSGLPRSDVKAYNEEHGTYPVKREGQFGTEQYGHRTAVGFNAALGRAYILGPEGILVVDGRSEPPLAGLTYPALGTYGAGEHEMLPALSNDGTPLDELYAYSIGGRHYVAIPVGGQGYVLFEDKVSILGSRAPSDPDRLTTQVEEREGETVSTLSGAGEAAGARVVVAGGVTKGANTADPACRGADFSVITTLSTGTNIVFDPLTKVSRVERNLFDGECLADVLFSQGHREASLGFSEVESATDVGVNATAQGVHVASDSDKATDADLRAAGRCHGDTLRRVGESAVDYPAGGFGAGSPPDPPPSEEMGPLFGPLFGGYGEFCDGVREGLLDPAGLDTSEGTQGQGFGARAQCTDYGTSADSEEAGGERFADFSSAVTCDGAAPQGRAESSTSGFVLPSEKDPLVVVESASSSIDSFRVVEGGKAFQVTEAKALAEGVHIGPLSLGAVRTTSVTRAGGRTGTAGATLTREWCDVTVGAEVLTEGCRAVTPEDPLVAQVADEISLAFPKLRISVPRANGPEHKGEATPGGYQGVVIKDEGLRATDETVNDDNSIIVPALQVVFLNDGAEGRNRWIVGLAGVEAEARYGINVLPSFTGLSGSSSFTTTRATPSTRRVVPGRKALPRGSTIIEGETFENLLAGNPVPPQNPAQRFVTWVPNALKDLLRLLIQHPLEFALLFLVFSLLATPGYLAYRRRTFQAVVSN